MNEYNLVDIHFHTSDSYDTKNSYDYNEISEYLKKKEIDIKLLIKTDHNVIGFETYRKFFGKLSPEVKLLPGVELNIEADSGKVHWLLIFNDEQFMEEKKVEDENGEEAIDYRGNIFEKKFNKLLYGDVKNIEPQNFNAINSKDIIDLIISEGLDVIAIPHLNKSSGIWNKNNRKSLFELIRKVNEGIIFGFESKEYSEFYKNCIEETSKFIEKHSGENQGEIEYRDFLQEIEKDRKFTEYAILYGSDFHLVNNKQDPLNQCLDIGEYEKLLNNLCYIRSEPTFDGLKIALSDSESRIVKYDRKESIEKYPYNVIEKIIYTNNGEREEILFGSNFNSIIGLRGSGKSYILNAITQNIDKYSDSKITEQLSDFKIKFLDDEKLYDPGDLNDEKIEYIGQKNSSNQENDLNLYEILMDTPHDNKKFKDVLEKYTTKIPQQEKIIKLSDLLNELFHIYEEKKTIFSRKILNIDMIKEYNELNNSKEIKALKIFESLGAKLEKRLENLDERIEKLEKLVKTLSKGDWKLKAYEEKFLTKEEIEVIKSFDIDIILNIYTKILDITIDGRLRLKSKIKFNERISNSIRNQLDIKEQNLDKARENIKDRIKTMKYLIVKEENLKNEDIKLDYIENEYKLKNDKKKIQYCIKLLINEEVLNDVFKNFNGGAIELAKKEELVLSNLSSFTFEKVVKLLDLKNKRKKDYFELFPQQEYINIIENDGSIRNLKNLSPGERTTYILNIVLNQNQYIPLLIDQPEDDLDNNTIFEYLVSELRKIKFKRQIIIVSHNANIVLNADSDYVIYCSRQDDKFNYQSMKLESKKKFLYTNYDGEKSNETSLNICSKILEGGEKALNKRIKKIGYKNIFLRGGK